MQEKLGKVGFLDWEHPSVPTKPAIVYRRREILPPRNIGSGISLIQTMHGRFSKDRRSAPTAPPEFFRLPIQAC